MKRLLFNISASFLVCIPSMAQVTVTTERIGSGTSTSGVFGFLTIPPNSSTDVANGKLFAVLAGTPATGGPISNLTNGPAQTNQDSVAESFFAIGNVANGTEKIRVQIDLEVPHLLTQINTYSWHANSRAAQAYRVYGAKSPINNAPNFTAAAFQDNDTLSALGYTLIANVATAKTSGGQYGATVAGTIGEYRYLLFDMSPTNLTTPRPTFFGEIDIYGTPTAAPTFPLSIMPSTPPSAGFDLQWQSRHAKAYQLRTSTDLSTPINEWELVAGNITATPPQNLYQVPYAGPRRFYAVEETVAPPLLFANFEQNDGGFTVSTSSGSNWAYGSPTSGSVENPNPGGYVISGNASTTNCWGTVIGNPGYYEPSTVTRLRSPVINLTNALGATLTFAEALDIENGDTAVVNIISANSDTIIAPAIRTSTDTVQSSANWSVVSPISLASGVGQQVRIEWVLTTQAAVDFMGWYIDDVTVTETPN